MPVQKVTFRPGINKQLTPTANEGGWSDGNLIRFKDGLPQPIGGWLQAISAPFLGIARKLHSWATLGNSPLWALGTTQRLYVGGGATTTPYAYNDVTPYYTTLTSTTALHTTSGSSSVQVTTPIIQVAVGDRIHLTSCTIGGLTLVGDYTVATLTGFPGTFTITAGGTAGSTSSTSTSTTIGFYLQNGAADAVAPRQPLLWSMDHWGQDLIACVRDAAIYLYQSGGSLSASQAALLSPSTAPVSAKCILVGMPERHLCAYGAADSGGTADPLLVRWSDVEDYTVWTATATNSAGSFRISGGTQIMTAVAAASEILIFTDATLWAQRFQGSPFVYGFYQLGQACGAISPNSVATVNGVAYWMGRNNFYRYAGQIETVPCSVWDAVFRNLSATQQMKVHAAVNSAFNEIWWYYPSSGSSEIDRYVKVNLLDGVWDSGVLARTAWEDSVTFGLPLAAGTDGYLYQHETGTTAAGAQLSAYVESGFIDLGDGGDMMFVDRAIPDFADQAGTVNLTLSGRDYPNGGEAVRGPFPITTSTRFLSPRLRAMQAKLRLASAGTNAFWRLGAFRFRVAPDGSKG